MLKDMKIGIRLGGGFAAMILLMAVIIIISLFNINKSDRMLDRILKVNNVRIKLSYEIINSAKDITVDMRNILLAGGEKNIQEYIGSIKSRISESRNRYRNSLSELEVLTGDDDTRGRDLMSVIKLTNGPAKTAHDKVLKLAEAGRFTEGAGVLKNEAVPAVAVWINNISELIRYNEERNTLRYRQIVESQQNARLSMIVTGLIALAGAAAVSFMLTLGITRPLGTVIKAADRITSGDLTVEIGGYERNDEPGMLMAAMKKMSGSLREQTREILSGVNVLAASTSQVSATSRQLATSAQETLASVSETTTTMEEIKQTSRIINQKASLVSELLNNTMQVSENGSRSAEEFFSIMGRIREQMDYIANSIVKLSEQSQTIGLIISSVNDLANQSNLLAVNAAIEASKAGEHGKGFTVVAHEVRSLAEQSKEATTQIRTILNDIQKSISGAVMATEQGKNAVDAGVKQSHEARDAIHLMAEGIVNSTQSSAQITISINEQVIGIDQVAMAMENIKNATEQIVVSTRQSEDLSRNLNVLGEKMKQMVNRFMV